MLSNSLYEKIKNYNSTIANFYNIDNFNYQNKEISIKDFLVQNNKLNLESKIFDINLYNNLFKDYNLKSEYYKLNDVDNLKILTVNKN